MLGPDSNPMGVTNDSASRTFEADAWRDPDAQREFLARVERYQREGPPPPSERTSWQEIRARYGL
jgi:hypothetical protein